MRSFTSHLGTLAVLFAVGIGASACKTAGSRATSLADLAPYTGEILIGPPLISASASFNASRVIGPTANLERGSSGRWTGWIHNQPVFLTVEPGGKITSPELDMTIEETAEGVSMHAIWLTGGRGELISVRLTEKELFVRAPPYSWSPVYLYVDGQPDWGREALYGTGVYGRAVRLRGEAASLHPPEPQFALALLGAF